MIYVFLSLAAPWIVPYEPTQLLTGPRLPPPVSHWLGTDEVGGDVLSRLFTGGRLALAVAISAIVIGVVVGGFIGMVAAFYDGWGDVVLMRCMDVLLAIPGLLLALTLVVLLGPSLLTTVVAIGVSGIPGYGRLMRGEALALLNRELVVASVYLGATNARVMLKHNLPMAMSSMLVFSTAQLARAILYEAGLSYLGLDIQPPEPSWGGMISSWPEDVSERTDAGHLPWVGDHGSRLCHQLARRYLPRRLRSGAVSSTLPGSALRP